MKMKTIRTKIIEGNVRNRAASGGTAECRWVVSSDWRVTTPYIWRAGIEVAQTDISAAVPSARSHTSLQARTWLSASAFARRTRHSASDTRRTFRAIPHCAPPARVRASGRSPKCCQSPTGQTSPRLLHIHVVPKSKANSWNLVKLST